MYIFIYRYIYIYIYVYIYIYIAFGFYAFGADFDPRFSAAFYTRVFHSFTLCGFISLRVSILWTRLFSDISSNRDFAFSFEVSNASDLSVLINACIMACKTLSRSPYSIS